MSVYRSGSNSTTVHSKIILNIYDLDGNNKYLHPLGLGFYHSGVQIGGHEYTFAGGSGFMKSDLNYNIKHNNFSSYLLLLRSRDYTS